MNNNLIYIAIGIIFFIVLLCILFTRKEGFPAPKRFLRYNNYHFNDHGIGTHLYQTDWTKGAFFQPFVPLDQGLYTTNEWSPRYIRHATQHATTCC